MQNQAVEQGGTRARIAVAYGAVDPLAGPDDQDALVQAEAVTASLRRLGYDAHELPFSLGQLADVRKRLRDGHFEAVFNLVEALDGEMRLLLCATALFDAMGLPYTGTPTEPLRRSLDKLDVKQRLVEAGLPTPAWIPRANAAVVGGPARAEARRWIVKSVHEHASFGLGPGSVVDEADVQAALQRRSQDGGAWFAEEYVDGREFNVSVLAEGSAARVLPLPEMVFQDWDAAAPRIVGFDAKWQPDSDAYRKTVRVWLDDKVEGALAERIRHVVLGCWRACQLAGYARIDLRISSDGRPLVIDVNTNPCLAPDAGLAQAAAAAGLSFDALVERILAPCLSRPVVVPVAPPREQPAAVPMALTFRSTTGPGDPDAIAELLRACAVFRPVEVDIGRELVELHEKQGDRSGYSFDYACDPSGRILGYSCFGAVPLTEGSFDIYWIAVHPDGQRHRIASQLIDRAEERMRAEKGRRAYVETSGTPAYLPARMAYLRRGYTLLATYPDFYLPGDDKVVFAKVL